MIETTRPELVAYQEERLAKFVNENQKLDKGQIVFAGDSITEFFALKKPQMTTDFPSSDDEAIRALYFADPASFKAISAACFSFDTSRPLGSRHSTA